LVTALSLPFGHYKEALMFNFPVPLWLFPVTYVISQFDIAFHGNTGFVYVSTLAVALTLMVFVRKRPVEKIAMVATTVFASFYLFFAVYSDVW